MIEFLRKGMILGLCGFIGWGLCSIIIVLGKNDTSTEKILLIHALVAPFIFGIISFFYFKLYNHTSPLLTALLFVLVVIFFDFFIVAGYIEKSYNMFRNILETWIPFILIFEATYITGTFINKKKL